MSSPPKRSRFWIWPDCSSSGPARISRLPRLRAPSGLDSRSARIAGVAVRKWNRRQWEPASAPFIISKKGSLPPPWMGVCTAASPFPSLRTQEPWRPACRSCASEYAESTFSGLREYASPPNAPGVLERGRSRPPLPLPPGGSSCTSPPAIRTKVGRCLSPMPTLHRSESPH